MTGAELAAIRKRLDMTAEQFGRALGYTGRRDSIEVTISRMERGIERGGRAVPKHVALIAPTLRPVRRRNVAAKDQGPAGSL